MLAKLQQSRTLLPGLAVAIAAGALAWWLFTANPVAAAIVGALGGLMGGIVAMAGAAETTSSGAIAVAVRAAERGGKPARPPELDPTSAGVYDALDALAAEV